MDKNLIYRYMKIERERIKGLNSDVVFITNKELGTNYQQGRFKEWQDGRRRPGVTAQNHILSKVLTYELKKIGLKERVISNIIGNCLLPEKDKS